jgi:hypothetical protein
LLARSAVHGGDLGATRRAAAGHAGPLGGRDLTRPAGRYTPTTESRTRRFRR